MIFQGHSKKGETIIEVIVSMAILAIILVGVYTVVVSVTNVGVSSRNRTIATNSAQKALNQYLKAVNDSCMVSFGTNGVDPTTASPAGCFHTTPAPHTPTQAEIGNNTPCNYIEIVTPLGNPSPERTSLGAETDSFVKIISHSVWYDPKSSVMNEIQLNVISRKAR